MHTQRRLLSLLALAVTAGAPSLLHAQVAAGTLTLGSPVNGTLESSDATSSIRTSSKMDRFTFRGTAGQVIQITMVSEEFDTYLYLLDSSGTQLAYDDDGLGNLDSRIRHVLPADGNYTIEATAFSEGLGAYTLLTDVYEPRGIAVQPIEFGSAVQSEFTANDGESTYSGPAQAWEFEAEPGQRFEVRVSAPALSPTLTLLGPGGVSVATGVYGAGDGSMYITYTAAAGGTYRAVVTSGYSGGYGAYDLSVRAVEAVSGTLAELEIGTPVSGTLESSDPTDISGYLYDAYRIEPAEGRQVRVTMQSDAFDPALTVVDSNGQQICWNDDDGTGTLAAACAFVSAADTSYTVLARSSYGGSGAYTLSTIAQRPIEIEPRRLRLGQSVEGELSASDPLSHDGIGYVDVYSLDAIAGARVAITLSSAAGARLRITGPTGAAVHEDYGYGITPYGDYFEEPMYDEMGMPIPVGGGSWSGALPHTGSYLISVTGTSASSSTYTLSASEGTSVGELPELPLGGTATGRVTLTDPVVSEIGSPTDSLRFVVTDAGRYRIAVNNVDPTQNWTTPTLAMRSQLGEVQWGSSDNTNPAAYLFADLVPGTYSVLVSGYGSEFDYTIAATAMEPAFITRTPIQIGAPASGALSAASPVAPDRAAPAAYYSLTLAPGETVSISLAADTITASATLYDELGGWINSTDANWGTTITHSALVPTTLTIVVAGYSMSDAGAFTLMVSR